jgi:hypothetical protein
MYNGKQILALPLAYSEETIKDYLIDLLLALWRQGEGFSGKRPLGNSGWEYDLYYPLIKADIIDGEIEDDFIVRVDVVSGNLAIEEAIKQL